MTPHHCGSSKATPPPPPQWATPDPPYHIIHRGTHILNLVSMVTSGVHFSHNTPYTPLTTFTSLAPQTALLFFKWHHLW